MGWFQQKEINYTGLELTHFCSEQVMYVPGIYFLIGFRRVTNIRRYVLLFSLSGFCFVFVWFS